MARHIEVKIEADMRDLELALLRAEVALLHALVARLQLQLAGEDEAEAEPEPPTERTPA